VGRRAHPFDKDSGKAGDVLSASASHDGYRRLKGSPVHRRVIEIGGRILRVRDTVSGGGVHRAVGHFHFHPDVRLEAAIRGWKAILPQGTVLRVVGQEGLDLERKEGHYAPEFGKVLPRPVLFWSVKKDLPIRVAVEIFEER
jgi:hypothetical protein